MNEHESKHLNFIQADDCWIIKETGDKRYYGDIAVEYYNFLKKNMNEVEIKYGIDNFKSILTCFNIIEDYLIFDNGVIQNEIVSFEPPSHIKKRGNDLCSKYKEDKIEKQEKKISLVRSNGWIDVPDNADIPLCDLMILSWFTEILEHLSVSLSYYNYKWYPTYRLESSGLELVILDLMQVRNHNYNFRGCASCGSIFNACGKYKYCPECREDGTYKHSIDKEYSNPESITGKRKSIINYMRNSDKFLNQEISDFADESLYYQQIIEKGKSKIPPKNCYNNFSSIEDYYKWLVEKHDNFKSVAKSRKKIRF